MPPVPQKTVHLSSGGASTPDMVIYSDADAIVVDGGCKVLASATVYATPSGSVEYAVIAGVRVPGRRVDECMVSRRSGRTALGLRLRADADGLQKGRVTSVDAIDESELTSPPKPAAPDPIDVWIAERRSARPTPTASEMLSAFGMSADAAPPPSNVDTTWTSGLDEDEE